MINDNSLVKLHKKYIKGTGHKAQIVDRSLFLCNLTVAVFKTGFFKSQKVSTNTRMLKHLYDKRPAEEYEFIIHNLTSIVRYPGHLYKNKSGKRGTILLVTRWGGYDYICSLETMVVINSDGTTEEINFVATCFRKRDDKYMKSYELLWSWKGGTPSS